MDIDYTYTVNYNIIIMQKYTHLRFLYRKYQYRMSDGYFTHYIMKIKMICRVRILWIIRTQVRINQRIRTHSFWVRILLGTNSRNLLIPFFCIYAHVTQGAAPSLLRSSVLHITLGLSPPMKVSGSILALQKDCSSPGIRSPNLLAIQSQERREWRFWGL